jgi:hypothetical protein
MSSINKTSEPKIDLVAEMRNAIRDGVRDAYTEKFNSIFEKLVEGSLTYQNLETTYSTTLDTLEAAGLDDPDYLLEEIYMDSEMAFSEALDKLLIAHAIPITSISAQQRSDIESRLELNYAAVQIFSHTMAMSSALGAASLDTAYLQKALTANLAALFGDNKALANARVQEFCNSINAIDFKKTSDLFYKIAVDGWVEENRAFIDQLLADPSYGISPETLKDSRITTFVEEVFRATIQGQVVEKSGWTERLGLAKEDCPPSLNAARSALAPIVAPRALKSLESALRHAALNPDVVLEESVGK